MDDHTALDDYPVDDDYIDVEQQRADVSSNERAGERFERRHKQPAPHEDDHQEPPDKSVRHAKQPAPDKPAPQYNSANQKSADLSHTYTRDGTGLSGTAIDEAIDAQPSAERDDRGQTRTGFNPYESDGYYGRTIIRDGKQRSRASWLMLLQNGYRTSEWRQEGRKQDNTRWIDTFTSLLECTDYQRKRVTAIIDSVDLQEFGPYKAEMIVLAAISLAVNEDDRRIRQENEFRHLVAGFDTTMDTIHTCRKRLKEKSDLFEASE